MQILNTIIRGEGDGVMDFPSMSENIALYDRTYVSFASFVFSFHLVMLETFLDANAILCFGRSWFQFHSTHFTLLRYLCLVVPLYHIT